MINEDNQEYPQDERALDSHENALSKSIDRLWEMLDNQKEVQLKSSSSEEDIKDFLYVAKRMNPEQLEHVVRMGEMKFNEEFVAVVEQEIFDRSVLHATEIVTMVPYEEEKEEE